MSLDLKPHIRDRGLNQCEVAKSLGVSQATVSQWIAALREGHAGRIPAEQARALADLLAIDPHRIRPDLWRHPEAA